MTERSAHKRHCCVVKLLFVCSRNQWRSPTAERVVRAWGGAHEARSAGTSPQARVRVNERMLLWADVVFVMECRHREQLRERFGAAMREVEVVVLDVPDQWEADDPELVELLDRRVREELDRYEDDEE